MSFILCKDIYSTTKQCGNSKNLIKKTENDQKETNAWYLSALVVLRQSWSYDSAKRQASSSKLF